MVHPSSLIRLLALLSALLPVSAAAIEPARLEGRWCLTGVADAAGSRSRAIAREWVFSPGGVLRVQSEAAADVRMSVRYELQQDRLSVPELDLRLAIERLDGARMTALGREGRLRYRFRRGRCREGDREAVRESQSDERAGDAGDRDGRDERGRAQP